MGYTSYKQRKALGRRYATDPALEIEKERLRGMYALAPGREALAYSKERDAETRRLQEEALDAGELSGMIGTGSNLLSTTAMMRALTMERGEPFFGSLFGGGTAAPVAGVGVGAVPTGLTTAAVPAAAPAAAPASLGLGAAAGAGAVGGLIGGKLAQPIGEFLGVGGEKERGAVGGALGGAGAAIGIGAAMGAPAGPVGIAVGAVVGAVVGLVSGGNCIIVTACTSEDSEEVNLTREYRDKYLSVEELRGYYVIAERVVGSIKKSRTIKWCVKKFLVDKLIEYGRYKLRNGKVSFSSIIVTKSFLSLCKFIGKRKSAFTRNNGEVI